MSDNRRKPIRRLKQRRRRSNAEILLRFVQREGATIYCEHAKHWKVCTEMAEVTGESVKLAIEAAIKQHAMQ